MNDIFAFVYSILEGMSKITGLSYKEINIIVYYIVVPFVYLSLFDKLLKNHFLKIGFSIAVILFLIFVKDFSLFSNDLFDKSVRFLQWFEIIGWNYIVASVIICVVVPFLIFALLLYFVYESNINSFFNKFRNNNEIKY
ncbi:MAG: hypothetical protein HY951_12180 [Bacteroidia bacterium]|nr:hypothetical protein [Bacteroidia bacterium]